MIKYNVKQEKRPMYSLYQRRICILFSLPFIWKYLIGAIRKAYNLDKSVSISSGFHCQTKSFKVGKNVSLADLYVHGSGPVVIGNHAEISKGCMLITSDHDLKDFKYVIDKTIIIDDYAWLTRNVTILPGVTVGRGAVVGGVSVVRKDVPPYSIVYGNPCKVIGFRFTPEEAASFEKDHYPESERISIKILKENYEKYYLKRIEDINKFKNV